jgi:hypothetical protein
MRIRWALYLAILAASSIRAATIDISAETSTVVHTGDTLIFHMLTWNFGVNAAAFGVPEYPTDVSFALVSAPMGTAGAFAATLESEDRSVSVGFGDLTFGPGYFQGSGYTGEVSTLEGYLHLTPLLSEELFSTQSAVIALRNEGPDITLGLAPYLLRQDLFAGLSGGPLSVGALPGPVELEQQLHRVRLTNLGVTVGVAAPAEVPEPWSGGLLLGGGVLLCGLSAVLARISRVRGKRAKNQPFASANPL